MCLHLCIIYLFFGQARQAQQQVLEKMHSDIPKKKKQICVTLG